MRLLLDTHAFLWAVLEPGKLSRKVRARLESTATIIVVSSASAWEIATKYRLGKLPGAAILVAGYAQAIAGLQAEELTISSAHALKAGSWKASHRDPFDRLLAAQADLEALPLVTNDPAMAQFSVQILW
jgi:PIN domain nuclease of toxin-antitoxin system